MPKVLVVDDSVSVRKVVERTLCAQGLDVVSVGTGQEAIARLQRERPDLLVCDVILPDLDGFQICEFVRADPSLAQLPVLLMSGIVNAKVLQQATRARSNELMCKPFAAEELIRKTAGLLNGKGAASAHATGAKTVNLGAPPRGPVPTLAPAPAPPAARSSAGQARPAPAGDASGELKQFLAQVGSLPAVRQAVLVDRQGLVIESVNAATDVGEMVGAVVSSLRGPFDGIGEDLGQGPLHSIIVEYKGGVLLLESAPLGAMLAVVLTDPTALGQVRYYVKKWLLPLL